MAENSIKIDTSIDTSSFEKGLKDLEDKVKGTLEETFVTPIAEKVLPSLDDMANALKEALGSDEISSKVQAIAENLGGFAERVDAVVKDSLPALVDGLSWLLSNSDLVSAGIIGIGTALEVFKAVELVQGMVEAFNKAKEAEEGLTVAQWLLNVAMDANIVGIIIAGIAGLIAGIIYLWNTSDGFREFIIGSWTAISEAAATVWDSICLIFTETIPEAFNSLVEFFTETVPEFFGTLWETVYQLCSDGWNSVVAFFTETLPAFFGELWQSVAQSCSDGWNLIVGFFTEAIPAWIESIGAFLAELPNQMAYGLGEVLAIIVNWCVSTWEYLSTNVPLWIEGVVNFFAQLPTQIATWLDTTLTNLIAWGGNMLIAATTAAESMLTSIINFFMQLPTQIMAWLDATLTNLVAWGGSMLTTATTTAESIITSIVNFFMQLPTQVMTWLDSTLSNLVTWGGSMLSTATTAAGNVVAGIVNTISNLPSQMISIGSNIVEGIRQGIENAWDSMTGWIGGLCDSFVQGFKDNLDIHSPSRVFRDQIGKNIIKGIGVGIELETPNLEDQLDYNVSNLTDRLKASVGFETARTTAGIVASANKEAGANTQGITNNNDNGINVNIENFNGTDKQSIQELAQEIAFLSKRKLV
ncbi:phage tail protein [Clostridium saccharoperbutylacetonicum]|uniref:phage tail protein n=1 Tax=Clostridium saccharoperbutylacetonicum TaxID=36745 RepID=UPI000983B393|nr:phage tail tape measure protein [Clostridium saccharoperbutylacetonicum]AQR93487.1 hypothetical protein CLSAP_07930 [Clostridium saccharoperbutylacetonicum]NSB29185.1 phage-related protein [Clostridium saccharoperbutylacetonicum]